MKFKIGDIVRAIEDHGHGHHSLIKGMLYKVSHITRFGNYVYVVDYADKVVRENEKGGFFTERFELAIPDTKLNRVLYPELTSNGRGFLS